MATVKGGNSTGPANVAIDTIASEDVQVIHVAFGDASTLTRVEAAVGLPAAVISVVPGTGATNMGKAVDSAAGATDTGVASLFIRDDVLTTITPVDGDYAHGRVDKVGARWVRERTGDTATLTNVAASASTGTVIAANGGRLGAVIVNDSTATLYLKYGATASTTSYTYQIPPGTTWEMAGPNLYTGIIDGIWSAATGNARVTELT